MPETKGTVIAVRGDKVVVAVSKGGCDSCPLSKMCRINDIEQVEAIAQEELKVGDRVELYNSEGLVILFAFLIFILPLVLFVLAFTLTPIPKQGIKLIAGLSTMAIYYLLVGRLEKKFKDRYILPKARKV